MIGARAQGGGIGAKAFVSGKVSEVFQVKGKPDDSKVNKRSKNRNKEQSKSRETESSEEMVNSLINIAKYKKKKGGDKNGDTSLEMT